MYKLIKEDGIHDTVIGDRQYHSLPGILIGMYEYSGPDPEPAEHDDINETIERLNRSDGINGDKNMGQEQVEAPESDKPDENGVDIDHVISQEDLDNNPMLVEEGVKVGDVVKIPKENDVV